MFQISFEQFLDEIRRWKFTADSVERIDVEVKEKIFIFYLSLPNKVYVTVINKEDLTEMNKFELISKCIYVRKIDENIELLSTISTKLDILNLENANINRG